MVQGRNQLVFAVLGGAAAAGELNKHCWAQTGFDVTSMGN